MTIFTKPPIQVASPIDGDGNPRGLDMGETQTLLVEMAYAITAMVVGGGKIYESKAAMDADLTPAANTPAIVLGDVTAANNGYYRKSGGTGTGSWIRVGDVPGYSYLLATNTGAGTANSIQATTPIPIPTADGGALVVLQALLDNTASPVAVAFNGGSALTIKTVSGGNIVEGGIKAGGFYAGYKAGSTFQLLTDQASASIQAAAEAALNSFITRCAGAFADDTAVDNYLTSLGLTKGAGTIYFNTTSAVWRYWNGSAWQTFPYAVAADGSITLAKMNGGFVDQVLIGKPMNPFSVNQTGTKLPLIDRSVYWKAPQVAFENDLDNPLYDGGVTQFAFQSVSTSTLQQNITSVVAAIGSGANSVQVGSATDFAANKTLAIQLDDGSVFIAKITGVVGDVVSFTPALGVGQTCTPDGTSRQVAVSRAAKLVGNYGGGSTLFGVTSTMGLSIDGEYVRLRLDNGQVFRSTIVSHDSVNDLVSIADAIPSTASNGNVIWVGAHDIDPNVTIGRRNSAAIPGDIGGGIQFTGADWSSQDAIAAQMAQIYVKWVEPNPASGYKAILYLGTVDPTSASGVTRECIAIGSGIFSPSLNDPGLSKANLLGIGVNNGSQLVRNIFQVSVVDFLSIAANGTQSISVSVLGAVVGDSVVVTPSSTTAVNGVVYMGYVGAADTIVIMAHNHTGAAIDPPSGNFSIEVRGFA